MLAREVPAQPAQFIQAQDLSDNAIRVVLEVATLTASVSKSKASVSS
jgi:hypothetical protein